MSAPTTSALAAHLVTTANALPERAELLARIVAERMRWGDNGSAPIVLDVNGQPALDASGAPVTPAALLSGFAREMPSFFGVPEVLAQVRGSVPSAAPSSSLARRLTVTEIPSAAQVAADHRAARRSTDVREPANPYAKATRNLTQQVLMERNNPEMAARMKAEAGAT